MSELCDADQMHTVYSVNVKELISALLGVWLGTALFRAKTHS